MTLEIARRAHRAWSEERTRLFGVPLQVFDELPDEATVPWVAVADLVADYPAREDEPLQHVLEVPLRPRMSASGRELKPAPPTKLSLRRSLARDELAVLQFEPFRRNLHRLQLCTSVDITWIERLAPRDLDVLDGLLWCGWRSLLGDLYDVWVEAEEARLRVEFTRLADLAGLERLDEAERARDEGPRDEVLDAIAARRNQLEREPDDEAAAPHDIPTLPTWEDVVAIEDQATISMWREAAYAAALQGETLHLFTPGFDPLLWRRPLEAGDLVQMRRFPTREEGCLEIAARVCQVDRQRLLELHYDDYERVEMWVAERLGKSSTESEPSNGPSLSQKLRRLSVRRKPKRPNSPP